MQWCEASRTMYRIGFEWRQENPSGSFIRLRARVGRYGEIKQRTGRIVKRYRPTEANRSKHASSGLHDRARCRSLTYLHGTEDPTVFRFHLSRPRESSDAERGKAATAPCATHGKPTVRQAVGGAELRGRRKRMPFCNGKDRVRRLDPARNLGSSPALRKRVQTSDWCSVARENGEPL